MATNPSYYFEPLDFVLQGATPQEIMTSSFRRRSGSIHDLLAGNANEGLAREEKFEVEQFLDIEHVMTLLKAGAFRMVMNDDDSGTAAESSEPGRCEATSFLVSTRTRIAAVKRRGALSFC